MLAIQVPRSRLFWAGSLMLAFWIVVAIGGQHITPYDPQAVDPVNRLTAPSRIHWFGTDRLGRDLFSRVLSGAREVLLVAPIAAFLGTAFGTLLGLAAGYFGGLFDEFLNRCADALLSIPVLLLGLLALTALGPSRAVIVAVVATIFTPLVMRTIRSAVLSERGKEYIQLALLRTESDLSILIRELFPNVAGLAVTELLLRSGYAVFLTATLSFLGLGLQPPSSEWGVIIYEHYGFLPNGIWWPVLFPVAAVASLILAFQFVAQGLSGAQR